MNEEKVYTPTTHEVLVTLASNKVDISRVSIKTLKEARRLYGEFVNKIAQKARKSHEESYSFDDYLVGTEDETCAILYYVLTHLIDYPIAGSKEFCMGLTMEFLQEKIIGSDLAQAYDQVELLLLGEPKKKALEKMAKLQREGLAKILDYQLNKIAKESLEPLTKSSQS